MSSSLVIVTCLVLAVAFVLPSLLASFLLLYPRSVSGPLYSSPLLFSSSPCPCSLPCCLPFFLRLSLCPVLALVFYLAVLVPALLLFFTLLFSSIYDLTLIPPRPPSRFLFFALDPVLVFCVVLVLTALALVLSSSANYLDVQKPLLLRKRSFPTSSCWRLQPTLKQCLVVALVPSIQLTQQNCIRSLVLRFNHRMFQRTTSSQVAYTATVPVPVRCSQKWSPWAFPSLFHCSDHPRFHRHEVMVDFQTALCFVLLLHGLLLPSPFWWKE